MKKVKLKNHVRALAFSHDGKTLAVSFLPSRGKSLLQLWDTAAWKLRTTATADKRKDFDHYQTLVFSPDNNIIAGVPVFNKVNSRIVDFLDNDGKVVGGATMPMVSLLSLQFSPDGKTLAARLTNNSIAFLDPATGEQKKP